MALHTLHELWRFATQPRCLVLILIFCVQFEGTTSHLPALHVGLLVTGSLTYALAPVGRQHTQ